MSRYLVTGGMGFLGSHLCEALLAAGHEVICMDSGVIGKEYNVAHLYAMTSTWGRWTGFIILQARQRRLKHINTRR